jgi:lysozyme family protein
MSKFEDAIALLLAAEGGDYVADDQGRGPSKWGVTLKSAQEFNSDWTAVDIQNLTRYGAERFYESAFWGRWRIGLIADQALASGVLNRVVNLGPKVIAWLQTIVGTKPDMIIGPMTAAAINGQDPTVLLTALRKVTSDTYHQIVHDHPEKLSELTGWLIRNAKC